MRLYASNLTAGDDRTIRGLLLPFNEDGHTNLGRIRASAGALAVAPAPLTLTLEHVDTAILGTLEATESADGWLAVADVLPTRAGDDALAEVRAGVRACLSVEVDAPRIQAGRLVAGTITGGSLVRSPAFPSARLAASAQPLAPDTDPAPAAAVLESPTPNTQPNTNLEEPVMPESTPATVAPGAMHASTTSAAPRTLTASELFQAVATAWNSTGGDERRMTAALSDIVPANVLGLEQPQYVGQLWNGNAYARKVIPLFNSAPLTSFKVQGWRWVTKPAVAPYAGNKGAVPSGAVLTEPVETAAARIAGAHDVDRKFLDFPSDGFWAAYYAAMTESYKRVSDAQALAAVKAGASLVSSGAVPAGVAPGMAKLVDGALAILAATDTVPTFALVAADLWRAVMLTRSDDVLAYLNSSMGFEDGTIGQFTIRPSAQLSAGEVLVGARSAATVHELGGEAPIRVEAPNIAQGGVDSGVFGYLAVQIHDADGLALVDKAV